MPARWSRAWPTRMATGTPNWHGATAATRWPSPRRGALTKWACSPTTAASWCSRACNSSGPRLGSWSARPGSLPLHHDERPQSRDHPAQVGTLAHAHHLGDVLVGLAGLLPQRVAPFVANADAGAAQLGDQVAAARLPHRLGAAHLAPGAVAGRAEGVPHRARATDQDVGVAPHVAG